MIVRVTEPQKECWAEAADLRGLSLAEFIRESVDERAGCDESGGEGPSVDRSAESAEGLRADATPPEQSGAGSSAGVQGRSLPEVPAPEKTVASAPVTTSDGTAGATVISTKEDVVRVLAERGKGEVATPSQPRSSVSRSAKRRTVETGDGKCTAYTPKGTKCKMCGKIHP